MLSPLLLQSAGLPVDPAAALPVSAPEPAARRFQQQLEALFAPPEASQLLTVAAADPVVQNAPVILNSAGASGAAGPDGSSATEPGGKPLPAGGSSLPLKFVAPEAAASGAPPPPPVQEVAPTDVKRADLQPRLASPPSASATTPLASAVADATGAPATVAAPGFEWRGRTPAADVTAVSRVALPPAVDSAAQTAAGVVPNLAPAAGRYPAALRVPQSGVSGGETLAAEAAEPVASRIETLRVPAPAETLAGQFAATRGGEVGMSLGVGEVAQQLSTFSEPSGGLRAAVGSRDWSQGLGQRLLVMAEQGVEAARLRLHPANLGPLDIQITVDDDRAQVSFGAQHAATRDALESALPRLRELFAQQGLELVQAEVSDQQPGGGGGDDSAHASGASWRVGEPGEGLQSPSSPAPGGLVPAGSLDIYV